MVDSKSNSLFLKIDFPFFLGIIGLLALGVVIIYSASGAYAESKDLPGTYFLFNHLKKLLVAMTAFTVGALVPFKHWRRLSVPMLFGIIILLVYLVASSEVRGIHGSKRWLYIGNFGLQPSELAKIALVFFLARGLTAKANIIGEFKQGFLKFLPVVGIFFGLVLAQPDYSTAVILLSIAGAMLFIGGAKLFHLISLASFGIPLLGGLVLFSSYRRERLMGFLFPNENTESSYQVLQAVISLGNGGWAGTGIGTSTQKLGYLPMPFTDTIFSILGEELGFIGTTLCLSLFALVLWRCFKISYNCNCRFGSLVGTGIVITMAITVVIHVGVCTGFIPTTGQPLPFVSYGGTSLCTMMFFSGVMMNISRSTVQNRKVAWNANRMALGTAFITPRMGMR